MLDVGDNLERAHETIPPEALKGLGKDGQPLAAESAAKLLNGLVNGVKLTERIFEQVGIQNSTPGVSKIWLARTGTCCEPRNFAIHSRLLTAFLTNLFRLLSLTTMQSAMVEWCKTVNPVMLYLFRKPVCTQACKAANFWQLQGWMSCSQKVGANSSWFAAFKDTIVCRAWRQMP